MMPQLGLDEASITLTIKNFVVSNFLFGRDGNQLGNEESFIQKGIIDSTGILELSTFVEDTYQIKIPDDELIPDNFDSIQRLVQYIRRKHEA